MAVEIDTLNIIITISHNQQRIYASIFIVILFVNVIYTDILFQIFFPCAVRVFPIYLPISIVKQNAFIAFRIE